MCEQVAREKSSKRRRSTTVRPARPAARRRYAATKDLHQQLALAALVAIGVHGALLVADRWLRPGLAGVLIPFATPYRPFWTGLGILAAYLAALLGLSYYARRWVGAVRWRKLHRFTALAWLAGLVHALGEGTDAGQLWFLAMLALVAIPALGLLATRPPLPVPRSTAARPATGGGSPAPDPAAPGAARPAWRPRSPPWPGTSWLQCRP